MDIWWRGSAAPPNVLINMATAILNLQSGSGRATIIMFSSTVFAKVNILAPTTLDCRALIIVETSLEIAETQQS
ncbi:MAG: hypothetical protein HC840_25625 [Leptolyngbyaceae cyanobacterium RM2_2_4]|nr:hypothetical protein [Leptolyngbyaceae cyanobacterium SM1_4_3]NJO52215.1 hypothetical protein [Leptolyngbyaceae cyanobacterium RM2_2_4]NJO67409.1 hypothetical protein [Leptolyngbyaceae cyanobacterium RM1_405_57]